MAAISSSSTVAEIEAAYLDNVSYLEDQSVSKCRAFITACSALLIRLPSSSTKGSNSLSFSLPEIARQLDKARVWLEEHTTDTADLPSSPNTRVDFRMSRT